MSFSSFLGWRASALTVALAVGLVSLNGCPDPDQAYDDFAERFDNINNNTGAGDTGGAGGGPACTAPAEGAFDGQYLFSLSASLNRAKAFAFDTAVVTHASGDAITVDLSLQPLSKDDQTTPVGDPLVFTGLPVAADGSFDWDFGMVTLIGGANPITGADVESTLQLHGTMCSETPGFFCGDVGGNVSKPIKLDLAAGKGSAFTFEQYEGTLPTPLQGCDKTPAAYQ